MTFLATPFALTVLLSLGLHAADGHASLWLWPYQRCFPPEVGQMVMGNPVLEQAPRAGDEIKLVSAGVASTTSEAASASASAAPFILLVRSAVRAEHLVHASYGFFASASGSGSIGCDGQLAAFGPEDGFELAWSPQPTAAGGTGESAGSGVSAMDTVVFTVATAAKYGQVVVRNESLAWGAAAAPDAGAASQGQALLSVESCAAARGCGGITTEEVNR